MSSAQVAPAGGKPSHGAAHHGAFRHPLSRLFVATVIIFLNFFIYSEDPVAHSFVSAQLPLIGTVFSFVFTQWPTTMAGLFVLKIFLAFVFLLTGCILGRQVIHKRFLSKRVMMFSEDKGTWTIMGLTSVLCLFVGAMVYNLIAKAADAPEEYILNNFLGVRFEK